MDIDIERIKKMSEEIRNQAAEAAAAEEVEVTEETLNEQRRIRREKPSSSRIGRCCQSRSGHRCRSEHGDL